MSDELADIEMIAEGILPQIFTMHNELIEFATPNHTTLAGMLKSLSDKRCTMCQGVGHHIKQCPLIVKMNKMTKVPGPLKKFWGTYKGKKLMGANLTLIGMQSKQTLVNLEIEINTNVKKRMGGK